MEMIEIIELKEMIVNLIEEEEGEELVKVINM